MSERESIRSVSKVYENITGRLILTLLFLEIFALSTGVQVGRTAVDLNKIALNVDNQFGFYGLVHTIAGCVLVGAALRLKKGCVMGGALVFGCGFLRGLQLSAVYLCTMPHRLWLLPVLLISELALFSVVTISAVAKEQTALSIRRHYRKVLYINPERLVLWLAVILLDGILAPLIISIAV